MTCRKGLLWFGKFYGIKDDDVWCEWALVMLNDYSDMSFSRSSSYDSTWFRFDSEGVARYRIYFADGQYQEVICTITKKEEESTQNQPPDPDTITRTLYELKESGKITSYGYVAKDGTTNSKKINETDKQYFNLNVLGATRMFVRMSDDFLTASIWGKDNSTYKATGLFVQRRPQQEKVSTSEINEIANKYEAALGDKLGNKKFTFAPCSWYEMKWIFDLEDRDVTKEERNANFNMGKIYHFVCKNNEVYWSKDGKWKLYSFTISPGESQDYDFAGLLDIDFRLRIDIDAYNKY